MAEYYNIEAIWHNKKAPLTAVRDFRCPRSKPYTPPLASDLLQVIVPLAKLELPAPSSPPT